MSEVQRHRAEKMLRSAIRASTAKIDGYLGYLDSAESGHGHTMREVCQALGYPLLEATLDELALIDKQLTSVVAKHRLKADAAPGGP